MMTNKRIGYLDLQPSERRLFYEDELRKNLGIINSCASEVWLTLHGNIMTSIYPLVIELLIIIEKLVGDPLRLLEIFRGVSGNNFLSLENPNWLSSCFCTTLGSFLSYQWDIQIRKAYIRVRMRTIIFLIVLLNRVLGWGGMWRGFFTK